jgi:hypothetical protein
MAPPPNDVCSDITLRQRTVRGARILSEVVAPIIVSSQAALRPDQLLQLLRESFYDLSSGLGIHMLRILVTVFSFLLFPVLAASQEQGTQATPEQPAATQAAPEAPASAGSSDVVVGVYVNDIQQLDLLSHSYAMDFYVWFRWQNADVNPQATLEFMNPFQLWGHVATPLYEAPQDLPDGWKYMAIRYQGQFNSKLPLEKYPFDDQNLLIEFEDNSGAKDLLKYVADTNPITINEAMTLPGYIIGAPTLVISEKSYPTNFGDTRLEQAETYSRVTVSVPVHRPWLTYAIKIILPIFLVAACAGLVYFIQPSFVEGRIGMGITALLTLVALQLTSNSQLPEVDYLMMIDKLYIAAYLFVIASLTQVVITSWAAYRGDDEVAITRDRKAFKYIASLYLAATVAILVFNLYR